MRQPVTVFSALAASLLLLLLPAAAAAACVATFTSADDTCNLAFGTQGSASVSVVAGGTRERAPA